MITELEEKQLKLEIAHIFESGANEIRVFNMIKDFLGKHDFELNTLPIHAVGVANAEQLVCDKCETDFIHKIGVFRVCDNCGNRWVAK